MYELGDISDPNWIRADRARRRANVQKAIQQDDFEIDFAGGIRKAHAPYRIPAPDPQPWCLDPRGREQQVRKGVGSAAGLAPINRAVAKGDAIEPGFELHDRSPTPNTRRPASQQFLPQVDASPYAVRSRTDVGNAHGSIWGTDAAALAAYKNSVRTVLPGATFPSPDHPGHRDARSIGWDDEARDAPATNIGAKFAKRGAGQRLSREVHQLEDEIHALTTRIGKLRRSGRHQEADGLVDELAVSLARLKRLAAA
jgi:hypothetical protein